MNNVTDRWASIVADFAGPIAALSGEIEVRYIHRNEATLTPSVDEPITETSQPMTFAKPRDLVAELRATMPEEVLRLWAQDAAFELRFVLAENEALRSHGLTQFADLRKERAKGDKLEAENERLRGIIAEARAWNDSPPGARTTLAYILAKAVQS